MNNIFFTKERQSCLVVFLIIAITFAVFSSCLTFNLLSWDDDVHLTRNKAIRVLSPAYIGKIFTQFVNNTYHPLTTFSFALEYYFAEDRPFLYHLDNVLLHIGVAVFAFFFFRQVGLTVWAAGFAALLFAIHPLRVESVAWVTERKDVLFGIFYLMGLNAYLHYRKTGSRRFYVLTVALALLSILSKATALSFPLVLLLLDWYQGRKIDRRAILEKVPMFLIAVAVAGVTYRTHARFPVQNFAESVLIWPWTFTFYIKKFFFPGVLLPIYSPLKPVTFANPEFLSSFLFLILVFLCLVRFWRARWVLFSFGLYFLTIFFFLRFDYARDSQCVADRFTYLPSLGFSLLMGFLVQGIFRKIGMKKSWLAGGVALFCLGVLVAAGVRTHQQCKIWENDGTLWHHELSYEPGVPIALNNFALVFSSPPFQQLHRQDLAALKDRVARDPYYIRELERKERFRRIEETDKIDSLAEKRFVIFRKAVKSPSFFVEPATNLAEFYYELGLFERSVHYFSLTMRKRPDYMKARYGFARLCAELGFDQKAVREYWDILRLRQMDLNACVRIFYAYKEIIEEKKKKAEDVSVYEKAQKVLRGYLEGLVSSSGSKKIDHYLLGLACDAADMKEQAIISFREDLKRDPGDGLTLLALGNVYFSGKDYRQAVSFYIRAAAARPFHKKAYLNLGMAYDKLFDHKNAIRNFQKVIALDPKEPLAYFNLGFVFEKLGRYEEAVFFYEKTVSVKPDSYLAFYNLGNVWAKLGDFKRAENAYCAALKIKPGHKESLANLSTVLAKFQ